MNQVSDNANDARRIFFSFHDTADTAAVTFVALRHVDEGFQLRLRGVILLLTVVQSASRQVHLLLGFAACGKCLLLCLCLFRHSFTDGSQLVA